MKIKFLWTLIGVSLLHLSITSSAQIGKTKESQVTAPTNPNFPTWLTTGNSGTDPAKNFLGTLDARPLLFRVNNQRAGYLDFNDFTQTTAFGYQTLISNVPSEIEGVTGGI